MKLNLLPVSTTKQTVPTKADPRTAYASPVGWWSVTTEADCEGRTTCYLGAFYGHVAEIAFSLADKCLYSLLFTPQRAMPAPQTSPVYTAARNGVWISLNIDSGTWNLRDKDRVKWFEKWLNITVPKISVDEYDANGAAYYASVHLSLGEGVERAPDLRAQAIAKLTPAERKALGVGE